MYVNVAANFIFGEWGTGYDPNRNKPTAHRSSEAIAGIARDASNAM